MLRGLHFPVMDAARRVVLVEGVLGTLWVVYGLGQSLSTLRLAWWVAAGGAVGIAALLYLEEHRWTGWGAYRRGGTTIAAVLAAVALCGAVVVATDLAVVTVVRVGLGGVGVGLLCYRFVYGLVYPVPRSRIEQAGSWA
jgi:hypothetical protein